MSISFSENVNDEIITSASSLPEDNNEGSLRPKTIAEYIGQEKAKENLKILLSAAKQSLKGRVPLVEEPVSVKEFITSCAGEDAIKLIAYCFEGELPRQSVRDMVSQARGKRVIVLIGPEGDFSPAEAQLAIDAGFTPVHLGPSRLRTETAALTATTAVYLCTLD